MSHVPPNVPAVEVRDLRKEFRRRSRRKDESHFKRSYRTRVDFPDPF